MSCPCVFTCVHPSTRSTEAGEEKGEEKEGGGGGGKNQDFNFDQ